jgi:uncharacterized phage protein (TIGR01671 family)
MKREIKFRAWDKENKQMEMVDFLGENTLHIYNAEWENREDFELMEYTGAKDYDDKEIYEGDIVGFFNDEDYILKPGKAEICFDLGTFCMKHFKYGTEPLRDMEIDEMVIKVIGNIYENPELLKE